MSTVEQTLKSANGAALVYQVNWGHLRIAFCESLAQPCVDTLLARVQVPLTEALRFPLVLCRPKSGSGCRHQIQPMLQDTGTPLKRVDEVTSLGVMLTLLGTPLMLSAYLLCRWSEPSEPMKRFIEWV